MQLLDVLTLNQEPRVGEELTDLVREAMLFFPEDTWDGVKYLGNLDVEHHVRIEANDKPLGAFVVNDLVNRMRAVKKLLRSRGLLLGLTLDPIIALYFRFEADGFRRIVNLVRDYVASDVGLVSLFDANDEDAVMISAHGLGHSRGLIHHTQPVDLMYVWLLDGKSLRNDGFCEDCQAKLEVALSEESEGLA